VPFKTRRQPRSTLFPYTTLFRSIERGLGAEITVTLCYLAGRDLRLQLLDAALQRREFAAQKVILAERGEGRHGQGSRIDQTTLRSEEHTSELQSRGHLVCRLLLD